MSFGPNSNNQQNNNNARPAQEAVRPGGKTDVFNKVKFSSIKMGRTKQGSETIGLYMKKEEMQKLIGLLTELDNTPAGAEGCKLSCIVIQGKDYDSGYTYVNPKEPRQEGNNYNGQTQNTNGNGNQRAPQGQAQGGSYYRKAGGFANGKSSAREYLANKRLNDGGQEESGNS